MLLQEDFKIYDLLRWEGGIFFWEGGWLFVVGESWDEEEKGEEEGEIGDILTFADGFTDGLLCRLFWR
jgi:hypothetical protein